MPKKWGKIGAPKSEKRSKWLASIRKGKRKKKSSGKRKSRKKSSRNRTVAYNPIC